METFDFIVGKTIESVIGLESQSEKVVLTFTDDTYVIFHHQQSCCESVYLEDYELTGKLEYGVINDAYSTSKCDDDEECDNIKLWTFYNINTSKGTLNLRWYGTSNGYYSVGVSVNYIEEQYDANDNSDW